MNGKHYFKSLKDLLGASRMKVAIQNNDKEKTIEVVNKLKVLLKKANIEIDPVKPDILITVGGDGTLLSGFHRYAHQLDSIRFIGVHTGHLGFYTDWREFELESLVESIKKDDGEYVAYPLLDVSVTYEGNRQANNFLALNEATIQKVGGTMVSDVYIDRQHFERFRGDGICVSTPTGSTGYSKSIGGAVLHPGLKALQMTEIASINNRVYRTLSSPLIIAEDEVINLDLLESQDLLLTLDHITATETEVKNIRMRIAKDSIRFARYRHTHFWDRVSDAFIGERF